MTTPATAADPRIALLLGILDEAYSRKGWHGTTLRGSVRGVDVELAAWRPQPERHSIWELVVHAAYWKYAVRRRLTGEGKGAFPWKGSNWFPIPDAADQPAWKAAVALMDEQHALLRDAVAAFDPARLHEPSPTGKWEAVQQIYGAAAHDAYHTGQIQLIKRLRASG